MLRAGREDGVGTSLSHHPRLPDSSKVHEHGLHGLQAVPWFTGAPPANGGGLFLPPMCSTHTLDLKDAPLTVHFKKQQDAVSEEEEEEVREPVYWSHEIDTTVWKPRKSKWSDGSSYTDCPKVQLIGSAVLLTDSLVLLIGSAVLLTESYVYSYAHSFAFFSTLTSLLLRPSASFLHPFCILCQVLSKAFKATWDRIAGKKGFCNTLLKHWQFSTDTRLAALPIEAMLEEMKGACKAMYYATISLFIHSACQGTGNCFTLEANEWQDFCVVSGFFNNNSKYLNAAGVGMTFMSANMTGDAGREYISYSQYTTYCTHTVHDGGCRRSGAEGGR
jgi:hypothetical protein